MFNAENDSNYKMNPNVYIFLQCYNIYRQLMNIKQMKTIRI